MLWWAMEHEKTCEDNNAQGVVRGCCFGAQSLSWLGELLVREELLRCPFCSLFGGRVRCWS